MPSYIFLVKSSGRSLSPTEKVLVDIVNSPLSVEILYNVINNLRIEAGISDYEVRQLLIDEFNDWDKWTFKLFKQWKHTFTLTCVCLTILV